MENTVDYLYFLSHDIVYKKRISYTVVSEAVSNTDFYTEKDSAVEVYQKVALE